MCVWRYTPTCCVSVLVWARNQSAFKRTKNISKPAGYCAAPYSTCIPLVFPLCTGVRWSILLTCTLKPLLEMCAIRHMLHVPHGHLTQRNHRSPRIPLPFHGITPLFMIFHVQRASTYTPHALLFPRHPLDQQNTGMLRSVPGLEMVAKSFMGELVSCMGEKSGEKALWE